MNCKNCGGEIKYPKPIQLGDFCSVDCLFSYSDTVVVEDYLIADNNKKAAPTSTEIHFDLIKRKVEKNSQFVISNKTLKPYMNLKAWGVFLLLNNFMVVRYDDEYSVIKRSIL